MPALDTQWYAPHGAVSGTPTVENIMVGNKKKTIATIDGEQVVKNMQLAAKMQAIGKSYYTADGVEHTVVKYMQQGNSMCPLALVGDNKYIQVYESPKKAARNARNAEDSRQRRLSKKLAKSPNSSVSKKRSAPSRPSGAVAAQTAAQAQAAAQLQELNNRHDTLVHQHQENLQELNKHITAQRQLIAKQIQLADELKKVQKSIDACARQLKPLGSRKRRKIVSPASAATVPTTPPAKSAATSPPSAPKKTPSPGADADTSADTDTDVVMSDDSGAAQDQPPADIVMTTETTTVYTAPKAAVPAPKAPPPRPAPPRAQGRRPAPAAPPPPAAPAAVPKAAVPAPKAAAPVPKAAVPAPKADAVPAPKADAAPAPVPAVPAPTSVAVMLKSGEIEHVKSFHRLTQLYSSMHVKPETFFGQALEHDLLWDGMNKSQRTFVRSQCQQDKYAHIRDSDAYKRRFP